MPYVLLKTRATSDCHRASSSLPKAIDIVPMSGSDHTYARIDRLTRELIPMSEILKRGCCSEFRFFVFWLSLPLNTFLIIILVLDERCFQGRKNTELGQDSSTKVLAEIAFDGCISENMRFRCKNDVFPGVVFVIHVVERDFCPNGFQCAVNNSVSAF